jgi:hypothetical protein
MVKKILTISIGWCKIAPTSDDRKEVAESEFYRELSAGARQ